MIELLTLMLLPLLGAINSQNFPDVLSSDEETKYLEAWRNKDFEARNKLIEHNLRLVAHIVKKFENTGIDKDDLLSIGTFGLIKAIDTFNFDATNKLATYAARCIENEILMYLRKTQKSRQEYSLDEVLSIDSEGNEMILSDIIGSSEPLALTKLSEEEDIRNLYYALDRLSKREREIITLMFENSLTAAEIARRWGCSRQSVNQGKIVALKKLRKTFSTPISTKTLHNIERAKR